MPELVTRYLEAGVPTDRNALIAGGGLLLVLGLALAVGIVAALVVSLLLFAVFHGARTLAERYPPR